jgi:hypothetical protein
MARDAESHLEIYTLDPVHALNHPVALPTGNGLLYVPLVVEEDMLREIIGLHPGRWDAVVVIPVLLLDLGMTGDDVLMAIEALLHRGQSRVQGTFHIGMAELALDLLDPAVDPVAEGYGLFRTEVLSGVNVKEIQKNKKEKETACNQQDGAPVSFEPMI